MSLGSFAPVVPESEDAVHETIEVCDVQLKLKARPSALALMNYGFVKRLSHKVNDLAIIGANVSLVLSHLEDTSAQEFENVCDKYSVTPEQLDEIATVVYQWATNFPTGQPSNSPGGGSTTSMNFKGELWSRLSQDLKPVESLDLDLSGIT